MELSLIDPRRAQSIQSALTSSQGRQKSSGLEFVNITNPKDINSATSLRTVRKHVMKDIGRARRRQKAVSMTFDVLQNQQPIPYLNKPVGDSVSLGYEPDRKEADQSPSEAITAKISSIASNSINWELYPRTEFPIVTTPRILALISFAHRDAAINYRPNFQPWFRIALMDAMAFYLTLSNSAYLLAQLHHRGFGDGPVKDNEGLAFYTQSLRMVHKQLESWSYKLSDGLLGAILGFACYDITTTNFERSTTHLQGLDRMIRLAGGIETIKSSDVRLSLLNVDVFGSFVQDIPPLFPAPIDLFREFTSLYPSGNSPKLDTALEIWKEAFPDCVDICHVLLWISTLARFVNNGGSNPQFWRDYKVTHNLLLVLHHLLSLERQSSQLQTRTKSGMVMREAIRISSLILLGCLKIRLGLGRGEIEGYKRKVMELMIQHPVDWSTFLDLRLWVLVVCGMVQQRGTEKEWYVAEIIWTMLEMGLTRWDLAMETVRELLWVDEVSIQEIRDLGTEVDSKLMEER